MAFTADEKSTILETLGVPETGSSLNTLSLAHAPYSNVGIWSPAYNYGDYTNMVAAIIAQVAKAEAIPSCESRIRRLIVRWDEIGSTSTTKIAKSPSGAEGDIFDAEAERRVIRVRMSNLIGISVPLGGFLAELEAIYGKSAGKLMNSSAGDR